MMYKDLFKLKAMLGFGPKTEAGGERNETHYIYTAFEKFFSKTMSISDYNGSRTTVPLKLIINS